MDGVYHLLWAALSSNPTLRSSHSPEPTQPHGPRTLRGQWQRSSRLGLARTREKRLTGTQHSASSLLGTRGSALGKSLFSRPYWGNPCWFLFHRLLICLNLAGNLSLDEVESAFVWRLTGDGGGGTSSDKPVNRPGRARRRRAVLRDFSEATSTTGTRESFRGVPRRGRGRLLSLTDPRQRVPTARWPWTQCAFNLSMLNVSCNSHFDAHFAAVFIDPRAK